MTDLKRFLNELEKIQDNRIEYEKVINNVTNDEISEIKTAFDKIDSTHNKLIF